MNREAWLLHPQRSHTRIGSPPRISSLEEALHHGVLVGVAGSCHTDQEAIAAKSCHVFFGGVLHRLIQVGFALKVPLAQKVVMLPKKSSMQSARGVQII